MLLGDYCGTKGRCADNCKCCEASDSDNGKDYLKKGTATGLMFEGGYRNCSTKTDSCLNDGKTVVEYYTGSGYLFYEDHDCSYDENKKCVDGHCGCVYDSDCAAKDNIKGKCRSPYGTGGTPYDYTCTWPPCKSDPDCVDGYCCVTSSQDSNQANQGKCERHGIYSNNLTWLCAPKQ